MPSSSTSTTSTLDKSSTTCYNLSVRKQTEKKLRRLTSNQAVALKTFILQPTAVSGATGYSGQSLGGTVSALERNGFIEPFGRRDRQFRWEISDMDLKSDVQQHKDEVVGLLNKLSRRY